MAPLEDKKPVKLYHLKYHKVPEWGVYEVYVLAGDPQEARHLAKEFPGEGSPESWLDADVTFCLEVPFEGPSRILTVRGVT